MYFSVVLASNNNCKVYFSVVSTLDSAYARSTGGIATFCVSCRWIGTLNFASLSFACFSASTGISWFSGVDFFCFTEGRNHCVWRGTAVTYFGLWKQVGQCQRVPHICTFKLAYAHISKRIQLWKKNLTVLLCRDMCKPHPIHITTWPVLASLALFLGHQTALVDAFHTEDLAVPSDLPMVFHTSCWMIKPSLITCSTLPHRLCNKLAYMQACLLCISM